MALPRGTRFGPFEIGDMLGAGGMGEVYRATDTRLGRTVAIKVLPAEVARDPKRRERFEREARAASGLNHPHICTLHDIGEQDGTHFIVMECVEGETLEPRLERGALPLDEALEYAVHMADALDKAHGQGIVHRDLKPGNVMVTASGVKLLDFGLAKLKGDAGSGSPLSELPTAAASKPLTAEGTILGTLQYMAPEQLEGKEADARTDIFAFGAIVYEMITGKKAFMGGSQASVISAIMSAEPQPLSQLQPVAPPALDHIVRRCLEKNPDRRWQAASDLAIELEWIRQRGPEAAGPASGKTPPIGRRERWAWAAALVLAAGTAVLLSMLMLREPAATASPVRLSLLPPEGTAFGTTGGQSWIPSPAVSPDGRQLAFVGAADGARRLWVQRLSAPDARVLPGTEDAAFPFWSPDGRSLGFFAAGQLKRIAIDGGRPQTLAPAPGAPGGTWNADDVILFGVSGDGLYRVSASGGAAERVTVLDAARRETSHRWPHFLPDGRRFLYAVASADPSQNGIFLGSLDASDTIPVVQGEVSNMAYAAGHLLYAREGDLVARRFDLESTTASGETVRLGGAVAQQNAGQYDGYAAFSASDAGSGAILVLRTGGITPLSDLVWRDRAGVELGRVGPPDLYTVPRLFPDENRLAIMNTNDPVSIWLIDLQRGGVATRFSFPESQAHVVPLPSPDGTRVVFTEGNNLLEKSLDGSGAAEVLLEWNVAPLATDWSSDGRFLVFEGGDIWVLPLAGGDDPFPLFQTPFREEQGRLSPDGRWIAYTSDESGSLEIYVQRFPAGGGKTKISTAGGADPDWSGDGSEIFYISPDSKMMAVSIRAGETVEAGLPQVLFEVQLSGLNDVRAHYAVTADGQRFLINTPSGDRTVSPLTVILNWTAELSSD